MSFFIQQESPSFFTQQLGRVPREQMKAYRPLEAQAENWHWPFYHILSANVSHKAIPGSRGWEKLQSDIAMGHAPRGVAALAIYHR